MMGESRLILGLLRPYNSGASKGRHWTLTIHRQRATVVLHKPLHGPLINDDAGAQAAAAAHLGFKPKWSALPNGNYRAEHTERRKAAK